MSGENKMARKAIRKRTRSATKPVRYAVVGLGHIAQAAVLPGFGHAQRNSVLNALVSGSPKKLRILGMRYGVNRLCAYEEADELFASGDIDAVYIALPNDQHREWTVRAARAGLHVLCEKPMALTARDCEQMMRATDAADVKLMIAYRLHFEQTNLQAAQLARAGKLGSLRFFSSDFSMQVRPNNVRLKRAKGGGPLYDIGVYCINAARYTLSEEPTRVWASATRSSDPRFREVEETVTAVMRFKDERIASFTCSFGSADRSTYTVVGTRGSVTLDPAYEYAEGLSLQIKVGARQQKRASGKHDQFAAELLYFSDCILRDRQPEPSGAEGLADIRVIEAMHKSINTGRWVSVNTKKSNSRPTLRQADSRPPVRREPRLIEVESSSQ
jgi:glucose-fructose oxidoreductase